MKTVTSSTRSPADLDFARYRVSRNPFAARVAREGVQLVHDAPSTISLRAIPEVDLTRARRNPYAARIAAAGVTLQVGRGRPVHAREVGPTEPRSLRLPATVWKALEHQARVEGITVHALLRREVMALLRKLG